MLAQKNNAIGVILYSDPFEFAPEYQQFENQVKFHTQKQNLLFLQISDFSSHCLATTDRSSTRHIVANKW